MVDCLTLVRSTMGSNRGSVFTCSRDILRERESLMQIATGERWSGGGQTDRDRQTQQVGGECQNERARENVRVCVQRRNCQPSLL